MGRLLVGQEVWGKKDHIQAIRVLLDHAFHHHLKLNSGEVFLKKFIEIGIGNTWFIRTEIEHEDGTETEVKGIARPFKLKSVYLRLWIRRRVLILDLREGIKIQTKSRNEFKLILGFYGV